MTVWLAIPSARPAREAAVTLQRWHEKGYGIAIWRDSADAAPPCHLLLSGEYPGYAAAVNALAHAVLEHDPQCRWIVIGGDDTEPDATHAPDVIAAECEDYFGGTCGVMQPTGDRFADGSIDRIAGSAWIGREWCERACGGAGPLWPEFTHMFVDQCLQETAVRCGAFWQRRDLIHLHHHFMRQGSGLNAAAKYTPPPAHLARWNGKQHWDEMLAIYERLRHAGFAPCMPTTRVI